MQIVHRRIKTDKRFLTVPVIADAHLGSRVADMDLFRDTVEYIREDKARLPVFAGDLFESILPGDPRFDLTLFDVDWHGLMDNEEGFTRDFRATVEDKIVEILSPIAEQILIMALGNHEFTSQLFRGIIQQIARRLKTKYGGWTSHFKLIIEHSRKKSEPDRTFLIQVEHGYSAPRTPGGIAAMLARRTGEFPRPDVIIEAHAHQYLPFAYCDIGANTQTEGNEIDKFESRLRWASCSPAMVDAYSMGKIPYAERRQYRPALKGIQEVVINLWDAPQPVGNVRLALIRMGSKTVRLNP